MFFGLTNSPATFQTMRNSVFAHEIAQVWLTVYMDDMAIHTRREAHETEQEHLQHHRKYVRQILKKLEEHDLFLKPEKCTFEQSEIEFLEVKVTHNSVQMDDAEIEKVKKRPEPTNITEVHQFLRLTGYYQYFIGLLTHCTTLVGPHD